MRMGDAGIAPYNDKSGKFRSYYNILYIVLHEKRRPRD